jgi:hypothetical protein
MLLTTKFTIFQREDGVSESRALKALLDNRSGPYDRVARALFRLKRAAAGSRKVLKHFSSYLGHPVSSADGFTSYVIDNRN